MELIRGTEGEEERRETEQGRGRNATGRGATRASQGSGKAFLRGPLLGRWVWSYASLKGESFVNWTVLSNEKWLVFRPAA